MALLFRFLLPATVAHLTRSLPLAQYHVAYHRNRQYIASTSHVALIPALVQSVLQPQIQCPAIMISHSQESDTNKPGS